MPQACSADRLVRFLPLLLLALTAAAFGRVLTCDFTNFDDYYTVAHDPGLDPPTWAALKSHWTSPKMDIYMPLTQTVWAAVATFARLPDADENGSRMNPYAFHTVNLLVHLAAVLFAFSLLRKIVGDPWAAAAGAAIFAVHPLQVEAVAWVSGLKDVFSGMLCLAALRVWIIRGRWTTAVSTILFAAALLAKAAVLGWPLAVSAVALLTLDCPPGRVIRRLLPWIVVAIILGIVANRAQPANAVTDPPGHRFLVAVDALLFYLRKIFWPGAMGVDYGRTPATVTAAIGIAEAAIVIALAIAGVLVRRRAPVLSAAGAVFVAALLPVLGFVRFDFQQFSTVADHYLYLAMFGSAMAFAGFISRLAVAANSAQRKVIATAVVLVLVVLALQTNLQTRVWKNGITLFRHAVVVNPNSWMCWSNLGNALAKDYPTEAIAACRRAAQINPMNANNWNILGLIFLRQNQPSAALQALARARSWPRMIQRSPATIGMRRNHSALRLPNELLVEERVLPFRRQQLAVRAALDDAPAVDHQNHVGRHDRAEPMSHDERRSSGQQFFQ